MLVAAKPPLDLVRTIIELAPNTVSQETKDDMVPLHIAHDNGASQDVIDYCVAAKKRLNNPIALRLLDFNIADMRYKATDFEGAVNDYNRLLLEVEKPSKEYEQLIAALDLCEFVLDPQPMDYQRSVYSDLYYWSPFILVGDWR